LNKDSKTLKIRFRIFRAIEDLESCLRYLEGHRRVLADHGFTHLTTNNEEWFKNPNVYCILAESDDDRSEALGGIRLELLHSGYDLPLVEALRKIDDGVIEMLEKDPPFTTAEMCGLWNSKKVAGRRVSLLLGRGALAFAAELGIQCIYIFVAKYTLGYAKRLGFKIIRSIGENGNFKYPNEFFIAHVLKNTDLADLSNVNEHDKERIFWIRKNWGVNCIELEEEAALEARYFIE
jgi:hypothetical protein